ncbi:MAG: hypothetical protein JWQ16_3112 [Novosphingobium sp.]|nr:hypothetical protein [Novosphingobium sp.]
MEPKAVEHVSPKLIERANEMLWTIAVILLILWALGFLAFHVAGGLIHLLLVIAVVVVIYQLVTGRRSI